MLFRQIVLILVLFFSPNMLWAAAQSSYPTKTTPVGADKVSITDSEDDWKVKNVLFSSFPGLTSSPTADNQLLQATGSGTYGWTTSPEGLNAVTATTYNNLTLTAPASGATLTLVNGSTLATSGAYSITLTSTNTTNVTLPTSGTLATTSQLGSKYISGTEADFYGTLLDPQAIYAVDATNHAVTVVNNVPAAFTITEINVSCDADPTTEITLTFQHKTAGVGYGSPTTIEAVTTAAGVATVTTGFDDATIPSGAKVFIALSDPDDALNECAWQIEGDWD